MIKILLILYIISVVAVWVMVIPMARRVKRRMVDTYGKFKTLRTSKIGVLYPFVPILNLFILLALILCKEEAEEKAFVEMSKLIYYQEGVLINDDQNTQN